MNAQHKRSRYWIAFAVLLLGILWTLGSTYYTYKNEATQSKEEFALVCSDIRSKIISRLDAHAQLLASGAAFFVASDTITRHEWKNFTHYKLTQNLPGIQGFGVTLIIPPSQLAQHVQHIRNEGYADYNIRPSGKRDLYTSIVYLEPFEGRNLRAFGYDMYSEPIRRKAMEKARDFDIPVLSGKVTLVQETDKNVQAGTLMYIPVYQKGLPTNTVEERRLAIIGWVYSPYRMDDLMQGILGRWDVKIPQRIHLQIYDDSVAVNALLYDSQKNDSINHSDSPLRNIFETIDFNGTKWVLHFTQAKELFSTFNSRVFIVFISNTVISILLFVLLLLLLNTKTRAERIAARLSTQISHDRERYHTLLNSTAEGLYVINLEGTCTFVNKACVMLLGYKNEQQLLGKNMHKLIHHTQVDGKKIAPNECKVCKAFKENKGYHADNEIFWRADGTFFHTEYWSYPILSNGVVEGAVISFFDITDRKQAEQALRESEERFRSYINSTSDIVFTLNTQQQHIGIFGNWAERAGLSKEFFLGRTTHEVMGNTSEIHVQANLRALQGENVTYEWQVEADNQIRTYQTSLSPIVNENQITGLIGVGRDITILKQQEEQLKTGQAQIRAILDAIPDIICVLDHDATFIDYHTSNKNIADFPPQFFIGKKLYDFVAPEKIDDVKQMLQKVIALQQCYEYMLPLPQKDVFFEGRFIAYEHDKILGIIRDITEQKQAEQLLQQTRTNYEVFFNTIDDFLFVLDTNGNIMHVNNTVLQRLGYNRDEVIEQSVLIMHPEHRRREAASIVAEMLAGTTDVCSIPLITKQGNEIDVETRVSKGTWNGNDVIFGVSKDISQIKLSEEKFSKAFHSNPALMALSYFETGEFIDVNDTFLNELGFERYDVIGKTSQQLNLYVDIEIRSKILQHLETKQRQHEIELEVRTKDGRIKTGLFSAEKFYIGQNICLITTMVDISYRKEAEELINKQNRQLADLNATKDKFFSIIAHDLKSPFNAILGFAELLLRNLDQYDKSKIQAFVTHINHAGTTAYKLLENLLEWSRSQTGRIEFNPDNIIVESLVNDVVLLLESTAQGKNITINTQIENGLMIYADHNMLNTIMRNLISNAIKFTHESGNVRITAKQQGTDIAITVTDNGVGISKSKIEKLFKINEKVQTLGTNDETGTGLGLLLCKEFVTKHGGTIWIESEEDKGSTFGFSIPLKTMF